MRRELVLVFGARVTWGVAALVAAVVGHSFVLAVDLYGQASASVAASHTSTSHSAGSAARARSLAATKRSTRAPSPPVPSLTHTGVAVAVLPVTLIDDDATVSKIVSQT